MKLVLDTDVVVAAVLSERGASRQILLRVVEGALAAVVSVPLMLEYEAVLKRPQHLRASGLSVDDVEIILDQLAASMQPVDLYFLWRPVLRDAEDDMVLETAVNGGADAIITFNTADFGEAPSRFGITLSRPGDLLRRL
ncbi:MAG: putative toxin-antitoxin system toxin component, PIN family [Defluviicoccus sp.]|nr:putative toxin-antitoxin system toxin component, PIN family [Defluviicoccus sp.]MDG4608769.1 putative toxin-antitoxin system toxin component, PIN family [Defluviicoccus sp.]